MTTWKIAARIAATLPLIAAGMWLTGCNGSTTPGGGAGGGGTGGAVEPHTHAGPHKGHVMVVGKEEYHAEWTHDAQGKVTFYILDAAAEKEVPIAAEEITIDAKIGNNPPVTYKLTAVNPQDGKTAAFELVDANLESVLGQVKSAGVTCTLHVNINGKQFDEEIKEELHTDGHDHGHAH